MLLLALPVAGQNITRSAGLRFGQTTGFTYRQYIDDQSAFQGLLSFRRDGIQVTGLKQQFRQHYLEYSENLYISWGYGGHIGFFYDDSFEYGKTEYHYPSSRFSPVFGVDAYGGIEYRIKEIPIVVGLDFKPFFELSTVRFFEFSFWDFGFNLQYEF
jgi:hypothetical protein